MQFCVFRTVVTCVCGTPEDVQCNCSSVFFRFKMSTRCATLIGRSIFILNNHIYYSILTYLVDIRYRYNHLLSISWSHVTTSATVDINNGSARLGNLFMLVRPKLVKCKMPFVLNHFIIYRTQINIDSTQSHCTKPIWLKFWLETNPDTEHVNWIWL